MKYKKTIILLALVVFLLSIAGVSASEIDNTIASENANTIELSTDNDIIEDNLQTSEENEALASTDYDEAIAQTDTEVLGEDSAKYSDLAEEISQPGNITLTHKNYTYDKGKTITISEDNKVIDGNGAVIDMNESTIRAFHVNASGVTIKNLTIKNANYNGDGGAIYFDSTGTVTNCNFINNNATGTDFWGGAVYFNGTGEVTNCNFTGNTATYYGGAIYFLDQGTVTNCNFTDNEAYYGGAVFFNTIGEVTKCNFTGNTADDGGAINIYSGTVTNCNFTGNTAGDWGGAIYLLDQGTVTNCNFTGNTADDGGAINIYSGTVTKCNFTGNTADDGGAIWMDSGSVENCNFAGNTADNGGAVYFNGNGEVTNCNFTGNNATGDGGAVYFNGNGEVTNCNFTGNNAFYGGAVYFDSTGNVSNCNFTGNTGEFGGAVYFDSYGNVTNCNFTNNTASSQGGAIWSSLTCNVTDCNFTNNQATISDGGAIVISSGTVSNCNFTNNSATGYGGAINMVFAIVENCNFADNSATNSGGAIRINSGSVSNCNFTNNQATIYDGGAIWLAVAGNVTNCNFTNNTATRYGGAIYSTNKYSAADTCIFKDDSDSTYQVRILPPILGVDNFTAFYGSGEKVTFNLTTNSSIPVSNGIISISVYFKNNTNVRNYTCLSGEGWIPDLPVGFYIAFFDTEYAKFQEINRTVTINKANSTITLDNIVLNYGKSTKVTVTTTGATGITAKIDGNDVAVINNYTIQISGLKAGNHTLTVTTIPDDDHNPVTATSKITVNKVESTLTVDDIVFDYGSEGSGNVSFAGASEVIANVVSQPSAVVSVNGKKITVSGLAAGTYTLNVTTVPDENHTAVTKTATITVNKVSTNLTAAGVTATYNVNKYLIIKLTDGQGNPLANSTVTVDLNGVKNYTTDENGQIKIKVSNMVPKTYSAKISYAGNDTYIGSNATAKVVVKKATPKITASAKTFKTAIKTKKYTITLKDNTGKAIKNAKVTLKVNGKTYKATTNSKGKATFKITKLTKKGTFKATITYTGNKYYNKVTKKVNIKVISSWKTISKGSKDKSTVREIQQALKNNGYYLTAYGHYLMVDGKFQSCTERSVKEFQHDKGLKVTGKVDEKTAKKLGLI
ncbi:right-handed parallel beta-helix repeat-containing protein [Methanobrevibacter sp.]|uniref:right-handed parallel beta-helix repeat-containing protein n=1 Tax=Methanobrevibacter sp. TaxID=66852 RepID=UPI00388DFAE7